MSAITAKVSARYRVVIPKEVRELLHIQPEDTILFLIEGERAYLRPRPQSFTETLRGLHRHVWADDPEAWLEGERAAWE